MDHLLAYLVIPGILGQVGYIAVHVAVDLDILHHLLLVGLQSAVEVVQIPDARHLAGRGVEELGGYGFGERVVAFLLPPRYQVVAVDRNHAIEFGDFVGAVLQVGIHGDDHIALGPQETGIERRRLAVVAAELHPLDAGVLLAQRLDDLPRVVGTAVVDKPDLVCKLVGGHYPLDPRCQLGQRFGLVIQRYDYRNIHIPIVL